MEERRMMDLEALRREALHRLWEFAVESLNSISVEQEQNFGDTLELSLHLCDSGQDFKAKGNRWNVETDLDGIDLHESVRLKSVNKGEAGVMNSLIAFAAHYLASLDVRTGRGFSQSMQLFLRLYEAAHIDELAIEREDDIEIDPEELLTKMLSQVRHTVAKNNKVLLHFSVSLQAPEDKEKYIGRKFGALHRSRELAVQFLYSMDTRPEQDFPDALELFLMLDDVAQDDKPDVKDRCRELAFQVWSRRDEIDEVLLRIVTGWRPERMVSVDRVILRLMVLEGFMMKSLPVRSAVSEARTLAGAFGTKDSARFVNGVMSKAARYFEEEAEDDGRG